MSQPLPPSPASGGSSRILKIVTAVSAVIGLGLAIRQVVVYTTEYRARRERVATLLESSRLQFEGGDYFSAWASLNQAIKTDPDNRELQVRREDVAMAWLDHSRTGGSIPTLTALIDTVSPALSQGFLHADTVRKADLLAHMGWGDFLRWREGQVSLDPVGRYQASLELDPRNPYALAMLGHWLVWQGIGLDTARAYFERALGAGRAHEYVRGMQVAAWANSRTEYAQIELIRIANEMRKARESLGEGRDKIWSAYSDLLWTPTRPDPPAGLTSAVSVDDLLLTYRWAFESSGYPDSHKLEYQVNLAQLRGLIGDTEMATKGYREVLAVPGLSPTLEDRINRALARMKAR